MGRLRNGLTVALAIGAGVTGYLAGVNSRSSPVSAPIERAPDISTRGINYEVRIYCDDSLQGAKIKDYIVNDPRFKHNLLARISEVISEDIKNPELALLCDLMYLKYLSLKSELINKLKGDPESTRRLLEVLSGGNKILEYDFSKPLSK